MPRRAAPPTTTVARVRAHFGLSQAAMALYLGVSEAQAQHLESGRRALTAAVRPALLPLLPHLPALAEPAAAPVPALPATLPPGSPAPEAAALRLRRRQCQQQAARLRKEAEALATQAQVAANWAAALPALLAAAQAEAAQAVEAADSEAAARAAWRTGWLRRQARPLPPEAATRYHLLLARIAALDAEVAALALADA